MHRLRWWRIDSQRTGAGRPCLVVAGLAGSETEVQVVLESQEEIRRGKSDANVYLFYRNRRKRRWICAVSKQVGRTGFLITAYPTDAVKEGERIWPK